MKARHRQYGSRHEFPFVAPFLYFKISPHKEQNYHLHAAAKTTYNIIYQVQYVNRNKQFCKEKLPFPLSVSGYDKMDYLPKGVY
mmetsp:Transcript_14092/g.6962  ORF Transcript_14092/g.6962 Transcript_14092/m.6962 type:complete len:84 (-) Transcript_14092:249-500(-)